MLIIILLIVTFSIEINISIENVLFLKMICKNPKHDLMAIPDILCTIREELYALLKKQYQYDKDFSKYVENELCKIRGTLTASSTDINEKIKQLEENIKNGSLIPTISKPKINTLF